MLFYLGIGESFGDMLFGTLRLVIGGLVLDVEHGYGIVSSYLFMTGEVVSENLKLVSQGLGFEKGWSKRTGLGERVSEQSKGG